MISKRNRLVMSMTGTVLCLAFAGCSNPSGNEEIASVNGQAISRTEFYNRLESIPQAKGVLNQLIQSSLIDQYAKDHQINIPDADVQKKEDEVRSHYPPGQFDAILKQQNLTDDDVKRILRQQLVIEKGISSQVHVSDADIKAYLDKNHATLDTSAQVRARHILVPDLATAETVEAKLKAGGDFAALARQYSKDPGSAAKGGELGFFSKGQMVPPFESAAFSQQIGEVGPPVKSPFGYHIIQVEEKKAPQVATLANSGAQIKETLTRQQEQTLVPQFLQEIRGKATISIDDDRLKDALPPMPPAAAAPAAKATSAAAQSTTAPNKS